MDGIHLLSISLPSTAAIITGGALWMQTLKNKSNGRYVQKDVCDERSKGFSKEITQFREEMSSRLERIEGILLKKK